MKKADLFFSIALLALSVFAFVEGEKYPYIQRGNIGSGFLPLWISALLFILSLANSVKIVWSLRKEGELRPFFANRGHCLRVAVFFVSLLAYIFGIVFLGMLSATFLYALFIYKIFDHYSWKSSLPPALGIVVFVYVIFNLVLGLRLPVGFWN